MKLNTRDEAQPATELDCLERVVRAIRVTMVVRGVSASPNEEAAIIRTFFERTLSELGEDARYGDILLDVARNLDEAISYCGTFDQIADRPSRNVQRTELLPHQARCRFTGMLRYVLGLPNLCVGSLDNPSEARMTCRIYADTQLPWYTACEDLPKFTENDEAAMLEFIKLD